jgi:hypothetical protein
MISFCLSESSVSEGALQISAIPLAIIIRANYVPWTETPFLLLQFDKKPHERHPLKGILPKSRNPCEISPTPLKVLSKRPSDCPFRTISVAIAPYPRKIAHFDDIVYTK